MCMGFNSDYTGEVLAGQGEMADRVDTNRARLISSDASVAGRVPPLRLRSTVPAVRPPCAVRRGGIGARLKRHPPWPDLPPRDRDSEPLQPTRLKRLFLLSCSMSKPLLCVTVTRRTMAELRRQRDAVADADLVELRLDTVSDPDVAGALAGRRTPVDRHLPPARGKAGSSPAPKRSASASSPTRSRSAPSTSTSSGARDFDDLDRADRRPADRAVVARFSRRAGRSRRARRTRCGRPAPRSSSSRPRLTRLSDCLPLLDLGAQHGAAAGSC